MALPGRWEHNAHISNFLHCIETASLIRLCCKKKEVTDPFPGLRGILGVWVARNLIRMEGVVHLARGSLLGGS